MSLSVNLALVVGLVACSTSCRNMSPQSQRQTAPTAVDLFNRRLAEHGSVSFRSNDGRAFRADADTEFTFYANGDACMLEYGFSGQGFQGNFHLYPDGCLISWFKGYHSEWPSMRLSESGQDLVLRPLNPPNGLMAVDPDAATQPARLGYWQFRMLVGTEEQEVLKTIKEWGAYHAADKPS